MDQSSSWEASSGQEILAFSETRKFISVLIQTRHIFIDFFFKSILVLSSYLRLGLLSGYKPSGFSTDILYALKSLSCTLNALPTSSTW